MSQQVHSLPDPHPGKASEVPELQAVASAPLQAGKGRRGNPRGRQGPQEATSSSHPTLWRAARSRGSTPRLLSARTPGKNRRGRQTGATPAHPPEGHRPQLNLATSNNSEKLPGMLPGLPALTAAPGREVDSLQAGLPRALPLQDVSTPTP